METIIQTEMMAPSQEKTAAIAPRPEGVPEKFFNAETGEIRTDALLKSYLHLEKKLAQMIDKTDAEKIDAARGVPASAEDYDIDTPHGLFEPDSELNEILRQNGFTPAQVQMVYDLAAERMVPMVIDIAESYELRRQREKLIQQFGGEEQWGEVSRQLLAFGQKALPEDVLRSLAASFEGVMALYRMMEDDQPLHLRPQIADVPGTQDEIESLMKDPKYWREQDPSLIKRVTEGFRKVYGG